MLSLLLCLAAVDLRPQEIASGVGVVYAVTTADVNRDGKRDILALTGTQLLWFENPSWARRVIVEKVTERDHVAVAPHPDGGFALAADWQPTNTSSGGSLHWISKDGKVRKIAEEPTLHRIGWADVDRDGRVELIAAPLHGRGTKGPGWTDGPGARILVFRMPANPDADPWPVELADDSLHIVHNLIMVDGEIWTASAEGVHALRRAADGTWSRRRIGEGSPGEIKLGRVRGTRHLATVEPWHGNRIVVYEESPGLWTRRVIEENLNQAHALAWADFDGDGSDELAVGWRGKPWGVALYRQWVRTNLDDAVAVEDLAAADLDGDGRPELIAGGRATGNLRIYWSGRR